jgi:hypothetical protein
MIPKIIPSFLILLFISTTATAERKKEIPQELFYKNKVISPHCINDRIGERIIDLEKCLTNGEGIYSNEDIIYEINDNNIASVYLVDSNEEYTLEYLGTLDGNMLMFLEANYYGGTMRTTKILAFKRDADKLNITKYFFTGNYGYIENPYIKDNILYFTESVEHQGLWSAILFGAGGGKFYEDFNRMVVISVQSPDCGAGILYYHTDKIYDNNSNSPLLRNVIIPDKIELGKTFKCSIRSAEDLQKYKPEIGSDGRCSELPYFETLWEYVSSDRTELNNQKDFEAFVDKVNTKCDAIKRNIANNFLEELKKIPSENDIKKALLP